MDNKSKFIDIHYAFEAYFKNVIKENHRKLKDVYLYAGYSESYGSKILSGEKHTTNRDVIIKLCVAGHFTLSQIDKALRLYGMSPLYSKDMRDACIIIAVNNSIYDIEDINQFLLEQNLEPIEKLDDAG